MALVEREDTAIIGIHPSQFAARAAEIRKRLRGPSLGRLPPKIVLVPAPVEQTEPIKGPLFTAAIEVIKEPIRVAEIQKAIMDAFEIDVIAFFSHRRESNVVIPRQIAMAVCKHLTGRSLPDIGRRFGGRDHTTVLHACRKFQPLIDTVDKLLGETGTVQDWAREVVSRHREYSKRRYHLVRLAAAVEAQEKWWAANRTAANFAKRKKISIVEARKILAEQHT